MTSDRSIQLSAITIDKQTVDFNKAEKTIVLDEPDIQIKVGSASGNHLCLVIVEFPSFALTTAAHQSIRDLDVRA